MAGSATIGPMTNDKAESLDDRIERVAREAAEEEARENDRRKHLKEGGIPAAWEAASQLMDAVCAIADRHPGRFSKDQRKEYCKIGFGRFSVIVRREFDEYAYANKSEGPRVEVAWSRTDSSSSG